MNKYEHFSVGKSRDASKISFTLGFKICHYVFRLV